MPASQPAFYNNVTVSGGPAPIRGYIEELLPDGLEERIEPGRVFDRVIGLEEVPEGYRAMNDREAIKVMVQPKGIRTEERSASKCSDHPRRHMTHIIVKLWPGRSEQQKTRLAQEIVKDVVAIAKCEEKSVSVAIEEIKPEDWAEKVYRPDILNSLEKLYKEPG
jgi:phenylpyruvate tautomerase PptA (4-oxalocrotonate tautomerase family)